jgi:hypothetical protein
MRQIQRKGKFLVLRLDTVIGKKGNLKNPEKPRKPREKREPRLKREPWQYEGKSFLDKYNEKK